MKTLLTSLIVLATATLMTMSSFAQTSETSPSATASPAITLSPSGITSPGMALTPSATASPGMGQTTAAGQPNQAEMMAKMMELSKLGENHKLLKDLAGNWSYTITMWMDPNAPPMKSSGTSVTKPIMEGRFFVTDVTGKMKMPGPDGKMKDITFKGMGMDGYDNVKKKFVSSWGDNMGTGIMISEGDYDPANKTFTYTSEFEAIPGMKQKVREVIKVTDKDHHTFEWYEDRGGQEVKTMEINYTRKK
jgi:Protein of unknown function (DUF1579)